MACANNGVSARPRVVIVGLASCFGCQLQITNDEAHLLDVLGQIDVQYWQLASSAPEPAGDVDVVVIEGAVTTEESRRCVEMWRSRADKVIAIGACAVTGGIPGMAAADVQAGRESVYGGEAPEACGRMIAPQSVSSVIEVDFEVRSCPIDTADFVAVLERALYGSNTLVLSDTLCGSCKRNESGCFWREGKQCLGLVTLAGCGAKCVNLGRECNGCRGLSPHANLPAARAMAASMGMSVADFDASLELFNQTSPMLRKED
ncbi:MAG: NADH:ubiquinone oxidoreductase [Slackia sp.]|nr:NADH:ubiquinone oxidoreductase [Slackia sp.]